MHSPNTSFFLSICKKTILFYSLWYSVTNPMRSLHNEWNCIVFWKFLGSCRLCWRLKSSLNLKVLQWWYSCHRSKQRQIQADGVWFPSISFFQWTGQLGLCYVLTFELFSFCFFFFWFFPQPVRQQLDHPGCFYNSIQLCYFWQSINS